MKCYYCSKDSRMDKIRFIPDGRVPGLVGVNHYRAQCVECSKKSTIDGKPPEPTREPGSDDDWIG